MDRAALDLKAKHARGRPTPLVATKPSSLSRVHSEPGLSTQVTSSNDRAKEGKSISYSSRGYEGSLEDSNVFQKEDQEGPTLESRRLCTRLLESEQRLPDDPLFANDEVFRKTCDRLKRGTELKVHVTIGLLMSPSPESLADAGSDDHAILADSMYEVWAGCIPLHPHKTRPVPDLFVGFRPQAFDEKQRQILRPFIGEATDASFFKATSEILFPFFTKEVKNGSTSLDIADNQNSYSTAIAIRSIVELFGILGRKEELNRQCLVFSMSHDARTARLYGYYPVTKGNQTRIYRHHIDTVDITRRDGQDRWIPYTFTRNLYTIWRPLLLEKLCSVVDQLPDVNFEQSDESTLQFDNSRSQQADGLTQSVEEYGVLPHTPVRSFCGEDGESEAPHSTLATSISQRRPKNSKKRAAASSP